MEPFVFFGDVGRLNGQGGKINTQLSWPRVTPCPAASGLALVTQAFLAPAPALLFPSQLCLFWNEAIYLEEKWWACSWAQPRSRSVWDWLWDQCARWPACTQWCFLLLAEQRPWQPGTGGAWVGWKDGSAEGCRRDPLSQLHQSSVQTAFLVPVFHSFIPFCTCA